MKSHEVDDSYHMAAELAGFGVDSHNRSTCEDQFWFPRQRDELHNHSPPCSDFIWS